VNGIIVINKAQDYTSFDVIAILKGILHEKHLGHTGTLDPKATGVLPVCIGSATRLIEYMDASPKEYIASCKFGMETDTQDIWGNVINKKDYTPISRASVEDALKSFVGDIEQKPSKYSAIRVNGRHLYSYAHADEEVNIPSRIVKVYSIEILNYDETAGTLSIKVKCGRGTYIRTICNDLGIKLGTYAVLTSLERSSACGYTIEDTITLDELKQMDEQQILSLIKPAESAVTFMNRVDIDEGQKIDFSNGKHLKCHQGNMSFDEPVCVFYNNTLCGIGKWDNPNRIKPSKVFIR